MSRIDDVPILRPGRNCWRVARADQMAVVIDAANYFRHLRNAMLKAEREILLIGWDFDTGIALVPEEEANGVPHQLGDFLNWLIESKPDLTIRILKWDLGTIKALVRGSTPLFVLDWITSDRIRFKLDGAHPTASAHHQKIAVIDNVIAFCGGIDATAGRWDTREHLDDDPRRISPSSGKPHGPWHDISTAVTGPAAQMLREVARQRWERATDETLEPPPPCAPIWPDGLEPLVESVPVAVSRTMPGYAADPPVSEIEKLYADVIAQTREALYIECQYFASRRIAEAICARLAEDDGPEIVVVNAKSADGWLEEKVMGASRARMLKLVQEADIHGRFRVYYPVTAGGTPIYVHAKLVISDDRLLRAGSSNLNNRSLGYDTECDISLEASAGQDGQRVRTRILDLRNDLIAEHLGTTSERVARTIEATGSLVAAIEALRGPGRSLAVFEPPEIGPLEDSLMAENSLLDPEGPSSNWEGSSVVEMLPWSRV